MALNTLGIQFINAYTTKNAAIASANPFSTWAEENNATTTEGDVIIANVQEIGELGINSDASSGYDQIEITTLADVKHQYMNGLMADGDSGASELSIKLLYDPELFHAFDLSIELQADEDDDVYQTWYIVIPEGGKFTIKAKIASIKLDSIGTNAALTMTVALSVNDISMSV